MPFFSIQLNSNRPDQIIKLFNNIEFTSESPGDIEVLLHIDTGDTVMEELVAREKVKRNFTLRVFQSDLVKGYATLWKPLNILWKETHPDAYFVLNISDEMLFETKGWDTLVRQYEGYYPDHVFRLRASKYRYRNYTDYWENGFAPDSLAFYTRKWLELSGDWNPCLGPDSFQQSVAFYLYTSDPHSHVQYNRDIPLNNLYFSGEGAGIGLEGDEKFKRILINNHAWFILMSHRMQQEAKRRAMRMKSYIIAHENGGDDRVTITESAAKRMFVVSLKSSGKQLATAGYGLSWLRITLTNLWRSRQVHYYAGGGGHPSQHLSGYSIMFATYVPCAMQIFKKMGRLRQLCHRCQNIFCRIHSKIKNKILSFLVQPHHRVKKIHSHWIKLRKAIYKPLAIKSETSPSAETLNKAFKNIAIASHNFIHRIFRVCIAITPVYARRNMRSKKIYAHAVLKIAKHWVRSLMRFLSFLNHKAYGIPYFTSEIIRVFIFRTLFFPVDLMVLAAKNICIFAKRIANQKLLKRDTSTHKSLRAISADIQIPVISPETGMFSILLHSNQPNKVIAVLNSIEKTTNKPERIEVVVGIDAADAAMEETLRNEQKIRAFSVRYIQTNMEKEGANQSKSYNQLFQMTNPASYFVAMIGDGVCFETGGWDEMLTEYVGYFPDHIFRIRGSKHRYRNYKDSWECGLAPETLAFYTRKWLTLQGDLNIDVTADAFQQCVSYYLFTSDPYSHIQYYRDIVAPFIQFSDESEKAESEDKTYESNRELSLLMSHAAQQNAKRRAMLLKGAILLAAAHDSDNPACEMFEHSKGKEFIISNKDGSVSHSLPYSISQVKVKVASMLRALKTVSTSSKKSHA